MLVRIAVLLSGGVDSSVALATLLQQGHHCHGLTMFMGSEAPVHQAARVARLLGVEHTVLDVRDEFKNKIVNGFVEAYKQGLTPNPCALCNRWIKLARGLEWAEQHGFDAVATGHYARIETSGSEVYLRKGLDPVKSQEYFLALVKQHDLRRLILPLGEATKKQVKQTAEQLGLGLSDRPESQDVCFITHGLRAFLREHIGPAPGRILGPEGEFLAKHDAFYGFTVGQRKGHGLALGHRAYVIRIEPPDVFVGPKQAAFSQDISLSELNVIGPVEQGQLVNIKIRAQHPGAWARITKLKHHLLQARFLEPQFAIAPGQIGVVYEDDRVLAGGFITRDSSS